MPIGGADMPVVISLLNSYAGLPAAATGFAINNKVLIIAGALDGASGFFLSILMSRAMNRSFTNVLFGAVGTVSERTAAQVEAKTVIRYTPEDAMQMLDYARASSSSRATAWRSRSAARRAGIDRAADERGVS